MAKIFKHSEDAIVNQLSIFDTPPTNTSVRDKRFLNVHPISGITPNTNVIHFSIKGDSLKYIDLQKTRLYVHCKIIDEHGKVPEIPVRPQHGESEVDIPSVGPVNHLLQSMWKQVEVFLGGKLVTPGTTNYPHKSMIKTLLYKCQSDGMKRQMCSELFYEDHAGLHDDQIRNTGLYYRKQVTAYGQGFDMEGSLTEDVFNLDKYLINGVDFDLKLYPANSPFVLMTNSPEKKYKLIIEDAILKCHTVDVGSAIINAHTTSLQKGGMAQYFFNQAQLYTTTIAAGQRNFSDCIFHGKIPHKIVIAFVAVDAYNGDYTRNPFNFHHYNVNTMSVLVNDVCVPHRPLEMNFAARQFAPALCNIVRSHPNVVIDGRSFNEGYSLFVFDIDPNQNNNELSLQNSGTVRVEFKFGENLPESIQLLVYAKYESCIQVDNTRAVIYTPL